MFNIPIHIDLDFLAGPPDQQLGFAQRQRAGERVVDAEDAIVDAHAGPKGVTAAQDLCAIDFVYSLSDLVQKNAQYKIILLIR